MSDGHNTTPHWPAAAGWPLNPTVQAWHWIETENGSECAQWFQTPAGWRWFGVAINSMRPEEAGHQFPPWRYLGQVAPPRQPGASNGE